MKKNKYNSSATEFFNIEGNSLFLDKVLVDLNFQPLFFICKDEEDHYYICLCTDYEEFCYIIVHSTIDEICKMLSGEITIREAFLSKDYFFIIQSYLEDAIVEELNIKDIDENDLPDKNKYYKIINQSDVQYLEELKKVNNVFIVCDVGRKCFIVK